jgi:hypothetical protein
MKKHDDRPIGRPGVDHVEHEVAAAELFHRLTISRVDPLVTLGGDE